MFGRCGADGGGRGGGWGGGGEVVSQVPEQSAGQSEIGPVSKPTILAVFLPFFFFFFLSP